MKDIDYLANLCRKFPFQPRLLSTIPVLREGQLNAWMSKTLQLGWEGGEWPSTEEGGAAFFRTLRAAQVERHELGNGNWKLGPHWERSQVCVLKDLVAKKYNQNSF